MDNAKSDCCDSTVSLNEERVVVCDNCKKNCGIRMFGGNNVEISDFSIKN